MRFDILESRVACSPEVLVDTTNIHRLTMREYMHAFCFRRVTERLMPLKQKVLHSSKAPCEQKKSPASVKEESQETHGVEGVMVAGKTVYSDRGARQKGRRKPQAHGLLTNRKIQSATRME